MIKCLGGKVSLNIKRDIIHMKNSIQRFREIIKVLAYYGFGFIMDNTIKGDTEQSPKNLRKAFEELGPTFIKIGQILSTRQDLLPENFTDELSKLQNNVLPESFHNIEEVFEEEFNATIKDTFKFFDENPLASASIAQVHTAILKDSREVIVKIQRPNIKEEMEMDLQILHKILSLTKSKLANFIIDPKEAIEELQLSTKLELDFTNEVNNLKRFKKANLKVPYIHVPYVIDELCSTRVITMEKLNGFSIKNISKLEEFNYNKEKLCKNLILSFFKQIFDDNFFHGDPHPGNILIDKGKICFIDFGIMGSLSSTLQEALNELIIAIVYEDINKIISVLMSIGIKTGYIDRNNLYEDIDYLLSCYMSTSLKNIKMSQMLQEVMECASSNNIRLPKDLTLLIRSLVIVEGVAVRISPDINILSIAAPYVKSKNKNFLFNDLNLENFILRSSSFIKDSAKVPTKFIELSDSIVKGRAKLQLKMNGLNRSINELNKMVNRLVFALIISAMIVSSSMFLIYNIGPKVYNTSLIGIVGYFIAGFMGFWLLISIKRSGKL